MTRRVKKPKNTKTAAPIKSPKSLEVAYIRALNELGRQLVNSVKAELLPVLKRNQEEYIIDSAARTTDDIGNQLDSIFIRLNRQHAGATIELFARAKAHEVLTKVKRQNQERFAKSFKSAMGVDVQAMIESEALTDFTTQSIAKNVQLIKSLPSEYLKDIETIVRNGVINGTRYSEIAKQITASSGSANAKLAGRIKTVARNEIQTFNSQLSLRRTTSLGIKKGIFRTSQDENVRKCHAELNNKEFDLKKGAWSPTCGKYIQPGITDINCRCSFSPVFELE